MATVTQHAPGTFCWPELCTTDQDGAKKFYTALFGWTFTDSDIGGGESYTMLKLKGKDAGALYRLGKEQLGRGVPPHWTSYVAVENADAATAKVKQLGGSVMKDPFDVFDHGRMAVVQDPTGATFCLWQAKKNIGVGVLNETGALCWTELLTTDTDKAGGFYKQLFGWKTETMPMGSGATYTMFKNGEPYAGGMMKITQQMGPIPSNWGVYFQVDDCDKATVKAQGLGAKTVVPPTDIPEMGRFSTLTDPQGAFFSLYAPNNG